jgi:chemotaxis protein methyltransferase CheR
MMVSTSDQLVLQPDVFRQFSRLLYNIAGINMTEAKIPLVSGRLYKRLKQLQLKSYADYLTLVQADKAELQTAVDLLTTNETHFFREQRHFDFLRDTIIPLYKEQRNFRCWSAASSTGQEAYSIAMVLQTQLAATDWQVFGSDISSKVVKLAGNGIYPSELAAEIPPPYLKAYCLKGTGSQSDKFKIAPELAAKVQFSQVNLNDSLPDTGLFDVIFLRNVLIYFQPETKRAVVQRLLQKLKPGGFFIVGHSETLYGMFADLQVVSPSVYRKL